VYAANACLQATLPRPDDGQQTLPNHQTVMREAYAEIAERGWGRLQGFVRTLLWLYIIFYLFNLILTILVYTELQSYVIIPKHPY
jgi:hypothetical protein